MTFPSGSGSLLCKCPAKVAEEREAHGRCRGLRICKRERNGNVRTDPREVGSAVDIPELLVKPFLVAGIHADEGRDEILDGIINRLVSAA